VQHVLKARALSGGHVKFLQRPDFRIAELSAGILFDRNINSERVRFNWLYLTNTPKFHQHLLDHLRTVSTTDRLKLFHLVFVGEAAVRDLALQYELVRLGAVRVEEILQLPLLHHHLAQLLLQGLALLRLLLQLVGLGLLELARLADGLLDHVVQLLDVVEVGGHALPGGGSAVDVLDYLAQLLVLLLQLLQLLAVLLALLAGQGQQRHGLRVNFLQHFRHTVVWNFSV
jgi:hypothetical protein